MSRVTVYTFLSCEQIFLKENTNRRKVSIISSCMSEKFYLLCFLTSLLYNGFCMF